jgi:predicted lysophospholipase L1 biosynthesis ABC-type transport system permease subunit
MEKFASLPGVVDASAWSPDMAGFPRVQLGGKQIADRERVQVLDIWPNYFKTMRLPLVSGRLFSGNDGFGSEPVVIVSSAVATRLWPGLNPLGQRVLFGKPGAEESATVVGVAGDVRLDMDIENPRTLWFYRPILQGRPAAVRAFLRVKSMDAATMNAVRRATVELRGDAAGRDEFTAMQAVVDDALSAPRFNSAALAALAAFSLFLAAVGVYGVVASAVVERTREIGIRTALGATPRAVLRHVSREAIIVIAAGTVAGIGGALATTRMLGSMLFGTSPTDPIVFVAAGFVLALAALVATFIPARRATKLDPVIVLRSE